VRPGRSQRRLALRHAARVAAVATLLLGVLGVAAVAGLDLVVHDRLTDQVRLAVLDALHDVRSAEAVKGVPPAAPVEGLGRGDDEDGEPLALWLVDREGTVEASSPGAPPLPEAARGLAGGVQEVGIGRAAWLVGAVGVAGGRVLAGESLTESQHIFGTLVLGEAVVLPLLLLASFAAAFAIGARAAVPVEAARQRQLDFTADASHELRTPLTVIEAETALALRGLPPEDPAREALERVRAEGARLRRIVEDLLWLARLDATPPGAPAEPVDLAALAEAATGRFQPVAAERDQVLELVVGEGTAWLSGPPDQVDRLLGVLLDNACRYAGSGGRVRVVVHAGGGRVALRVEDSGPGIPEASRAMLFDRFHRAVEDGSGHGLGLAIADAVVRATGGRWTVGRSRLGGASFEVTWRQR
jgi:signal transduction histidine kinase